MYMYSVHVTCTCYMRGIPTGQPNNVHVHASVLVITHFKQLSQHSGQVFSTGLVKEGEGERGGGGRGRREAVLNMETDNRRCYNMLTTCVTFCACITTSTCQHVYVYMYKNRYMKM